LEKRIIFRLPDSMYEQVKEAVKKGKAKTPSELIREAVREFLENEGEI